LENAFLAAFAYVPLLLTKPGIIADDTKQYLYLDPGRLLSSAMSMWDPSIAAGTVTHQNIGYLFPQGPFYWLFAQVDIPMWVAQRLWMGTLLFAAGAGVRFLAKTLGVNGPGAVVAGLAYELSPYFLQYIQQLSAILLPWSGLGWLVAFAVLAVRRGGWRFPALFAFVVALVGATNATSLIYVGITRRRRAVRSAPA
jgi:arabinofuranan 3-O-arabinosyltransferase